MAKKTGNHTTTLWTLIDSMQRHLELQGMDSETVDHAIARGLELLVARRKGRRGKMKRPLVLSPIVAKA